MKSCRISIINSTTCEPCSKLLTRGFYRGYMVILVKGLLSCVKGVLSIAHTIPYGCKGLPGLLGAWVWGSGGNGFGFGLEGPGAFGYIYIYIYIEAVAPITYFLQVLDPLMKG